MDKKRIIFIILFVLVVIGLGFAMYKVFFAKPATTPTTQTTPGAVAPGAGAFPEAGAGVPGAPSQGEGILPPSALRPGETFRPGEEVGVESRIVETSVTGANSTSGGSVQFYNDTDGKFYRLASDGTPVELTDEVFFNVDEVEWSPNDDEAIIQYPDGSNIYYNFQTKKQVTLPKHWEDFTFSPAGDKIAAKSITLSPENRWLVASDPDGSNVKFLEHLGNNANKVKVDWSPNRQVVALSQTGAPLGADRVEVLLVGQNGENFKSIVVEGRGFQSKWSSQGDQLLYSVHSARSNFRPELWVTNASGESIGTNRRPLQLNTWAEKCSFQDERYLYCGVPNTLEVGTGFQPTLADTVPDTLYKIDLQTGSKTPIELDQTHTIETVSVSEDGRSLVFTDKNQDGLFRVEL
jgi:WD40 repeat protein